MGLQAAWIILISLVSTLFQVFCQQCSAPTDFLLVNRYDPSFDTGLLVADILSTNAPNGYEVARIVVTDWDNPQSDGGQFAVKIGYASSRRRRDASQSSSITKDQSPFDVVVVDPATLDPSIPDALRLDPYRRVVKIIVSNPSRIDYFVSPTHVYDLQLIATDKGSRQSSMRLIVPMKNINAHPPQLMPDIQRVSVSPQPDANLPVMSIQAVDLDGDVITFTLKSCNPGPCPFSVNSTTGLVTTLPGTRVPKTVNFFSLEVVLQDNGQSCSGQAGCSSLSTTVTVFIDIDDSNLQRPVFTNCPQSVITITEAFSIGDRVYQVVAEDNDRGKSGMITYSTVTLDRVFNNLFDVDAATGTITVAGEIDLRMIRPRTGRLSIMAEDQGNVPLSNICTLTIEITDINNRAPLFENRQYVALIERRNYPINEKIYQVFAYDDDLDEANRRLRYSIDCPTQGLPLLTIDSSNGVISAQGDFSKLSRVNCNLTVTDGMASHTSRATFSVEVSSSGATLPQFTAATLDNLRNLGNRRINETTPVGEILVGDLRGISRQGTVAFELAPVFELLSLDRNAYLAIRPASNTTNLIIDKLLDCEDKSEFNFNVVVKDSRPPSPTITIPLSWREPVRVVVADQNDQVPTFETSVYIGSVVEEANNQLAVQVKAFDLDRTDPFNRVTYAFDTSIGDDYNYFKLNPNTGEINNTQPLKHTLTSSATS